MTNAEPTNTGNEGAGLFELLTWLEVNKKRLISAAVAIIVVGFGIYVYRWASEQKEQKAMAALMELRPPMGSTNAPNTTASQYLKVATDFPGTSAAEQSVILAAGAYMTENKYSEAQAEFQKYLTQYGSSAEWAGPANLGIATALEAQNKTDDALKAYQDVASRHSTDFVAPQAKLAMARIYEAKNQPEQAYKIYEELAKPTAPSSATSEAYMRRSQLLKKFPNLAATNAPVAAATTTTTIKPVAAPAPAAASATNPAAPVKKP